MGCSDFFVSRDRSSQVSFSLQEKVFQKLVSQGHSEQLCKAFLLRTKDHVHQHLAEQGHVTMKFLDAMVGEGIGHRERVLGSLGMVEMLKEGCFDLIDASIIKRHGGIFEVLDQHLEPSVSKKDAPDGGDVSWYVRSF